MAITLPIIFAILCFGLLAFMRWWLRARKVSPRTHAIFSVVILLGALLGVVLSLKFSYPVGEGKRVTGAPLPVLLQKLEDGEWKDYPPPRPVISALIVANAAILSVALAGPLFLVLALRGTARPSSS